VAMEDFSKLLPHPSLMLLLLCSAAAAAAAG
jgi:hypothetical protein